ncbi:hypothetical protein PVK06_035885 [Gossypium arboreum]|uniref:UBN2_2 domain-containing protein n=1 Tax=Gossypium arboreum TaxID=29729 RepID=A0ABR0NJ48_GOSAR|nr:hypothetical protein PVK06_035885 [Gossypium arboreum]
MTIVSNIKTTNPQTESVKKYLMLVKECFRSTDKSLASILMAQLTIIKYHRSRGTQEHIIEMTNIATRLKTLEMMVYDLFLVQFILNSRPSNYGSFQINYNTIKEKWDVNELASKLIQ